MALSDAFQGLISFVVFVLRLSSAQDVFSCGGFAKSAVPLDFSKVMVKLYTREMHLKYETDCAPNNGYYMIPVYAKGNYVIKVHPPSGWNFEPELVELTVDGVNDQCTKGVDINFNFLGFTVAGQVVSKGSTVGPAKFSIGLTKEGEQKPLITTETTEGGRYIFNGVLPGTYRVSSIDSSMCVERKQNVVTVAAGASNVAPPLSIEGYSITGSVMNDGQAVAGAQILLFSETKLELAGCEATAVKDVNLPPAAAGLNFVCRQSSSTSGEFKFSCVPSGNYVLVPHYKKDGVAFDLAPKTVKVVVGHGAIIVEEPFQVAGFAVPGRILWHAQGQGVNGAEILVNDKFVSQSNQNGDYLLERMSSGKFKITGKRDGVEFSTVAVELSPKNHLIPDIVATKFQVCGSVTFHSFPSSIPKLTQRKLLLTNRDTKEVFSLTTEQDGSYCRMLDRGNYLLEPQILANEKQAGVILVPKERQVAVVDRPINDINFAQFEAKISGTIDCIGTCKQLKVQLLAGNNEEVSSIHFPVVEAKETFHFTHLLPGAYSVKLLGDYYCWENPQLQVNVEQADVADLKFRQTGFVFTVLSTNNAKLTYGLQGTKGHRGTVELHSGTNTFCLPAAGVYDLKLESCHRFEPASMKYDTNSPDVLSITAVKHTVRGSVVTDVNVEDISIHLNSSKVPQVQKIGPLKGSNDTSRWIYDFEYWAEQGEELLLEPTSASYLFSPENHFLQVGNDCLLDAAKFVGSKGLFLQCQVKPALAGVKISLQDKATSAIKFDGLTDKKGQCSLGPSKSFDGLEAVASLHGYTFDPISGSLGQFKAFKLSELVIQAMDSTKGSLPGVLISLSGADYRSNNLTDDNGKITFFGLTPGEYFLRPVLKEFSFQPATRVVKIAEGSLETIDVVGRRVAYSCTGLLRYLAGQPVVGAVLEAISAGCNHVQEEATTGDDGTFRIRGLLPGCDYVLRMKENQEFPATFPRQLPISVKEADITDVVLVLRPDLTTTDVTGRVECDRDVLPSLRIVLFKGDSPTPVHSLHLQGSFFFVPPLNMDNSTYTARLESSLNVAEYENMEFPEITFKANGTFKFLNFQFKPKKKSPEAEISKHSYIALPLAIVLVLLAYNYEKVLPFARDWVMDVSAFVSQYQQSKSAQVVPGAGDGRTADPSDDGTLLDAALGKKKIRARKT